VVIIFSENIHTIFNDRKLIKFKSLL